MIKLLNDIEKKEVKIAIFELLKIGFFIGFIPSLIAILADFGFLTLAFNSLTESKNLKSFNEVIATLIPKNEIYMNLLGFYTISHMLLTYILGICVHFKKQISPRVLSFCEFFRPIADVLYQLLAIISGIFSALAFLMLFSTEPFSSVSFLAISLFLLFLSTVGLAITRVITSDYKKLIA